MLVMVTQDLQEANAALDRAEPVGLPAPLPLPYVVAARAAQTVNRIKGRPLDQPVTLIVESLYVLAPYLDADDRALSLASWLSLKHLIHLQLTVKDGVPPWAAGALSNGLLGVSLAWRSDLAGLLGADGFIYASSANATGEQPATTAQQLTSALGERLLILVDEPQSPDQSNAGSGMIVRIVNGKPVLVRAGIQNELAKLPPEEYLAQLYAAWSRDIDPYPLDAVG